MPGAIDQPHPGGPQEGTGPIHQEPPPGGGQEVVVGPPVTEVAVEGFVTETLIDAVVRLPEDLYQIERATWNTRRISPLRSRDLEDADSRYELNTGAVDGYLQDKDGLRNLRKWRVPSSAYQPYTFDPDSTDGFGILRDLTGIVDGLEVVGEWGDLVSVPGVEVFEDFGILGPILSDSLAVRIEYRRRGVPVSEEQLRFEIPGRYVTYIRNYAQARALEREGPGQDIELAALYQSRYEAGIARMKKRQRAMQFQRKFIFGGTSRPKTGRRVRLPFPYPAMR